MAEMDFWIFTISGTGTVYAEAQGGTSAA